MLESENQGVHKRTISTIKKGGKLNENGEKGEKKVPQCRKSAEKYFLPRGWHLLWCIYTVTAIRPSSNPNVTKALLSPVPPWRRALHLFPSVSLLFLLTCLFEGWMKMLVRRESRLGKCYASLKTLFSPSTAAVAALRGSPTLLFVGMTTTTIHSSRS
jgi:hypothetical protein